MAKETLFSTPREEMRTGEELIESAIKRKMIQRQNMRALTEANRLADNNVDFTATMESARIENEETVRKESAMENAYYQQGARFLVKEQLGMKKRLITEGTEMVWDKVLGEIIYDSYWLDEPVKEATLEQIAESITDVLGYIETRCMESKVPAKNQTRFIQNVQEVIESIVKEASERITNEAIAANSAFAEFELNSEEEAKLDAQLADLGRDEIVGLIKDKVAQVIQDERQKGKEKAEAFSEIDKTVEESDDEDDDDEEDGDDDEEDDEDEEDDDEDEEDEEEDDDDTDDESDDSDDSMDDEETEAEEAYYSELEGREIALEGANWSMYKTFFSKLSRKTRKNIRRANDLYKEGNFVDAKPLYDESAEIMKDIKQRLLDIDDSLLSTVLSWFMSISATIVAATGMATMKGGMSNLDLVKAHDQSGSVNTMKQYCIGNVIATIRYCEDQSRKCSQKIKSNSSGKSSYKYNLESALRFDPTDGRYTASEKHISRILEAGAPFDAFEDPSWNEFKSCFSLLCKKAKNILMMGSTESYCAAIPVIDEIILKLKNVPENVPGDIKEFVNAMVGLVYGAVSPDDVIISRMNNGFGSPDLMSNNVFINLMSISWTDILVNIITNLNNIKHFCESKCNTSPMFTGESMEEETPKTPTFESLILQKKTRALTQSMGSSLFEAMMMGNLADTESAAMESASDISGEEVEDAALIESILQYTVFETLDTLGIYKFRAGDIKNVKMDYMKSITEGKLPVFGKKDSEAVSAGKDKKGKKKVRIHTRNARPRQDAGEPEK